MSQLSLYLDRCEADGLYFISQDTLLNLSFCTKDSLSTLIHREIKKKRLHSAGRGRYILIPLQYRTLGSPPPEFFIPEFMAHEKAQFYIGLLSAAAYHGASHQAPQSYQIISNKELSAFQIDRLNIRFYYKKEIAQDLIQNFSTDAGLIPISTPEATAYDLLFYEKQANGLNHIATILSELTEKIDPHKLAACVMQYPLVYTQRLGYLLQMLGFSKHAEELHTALCKHTVRYVPLAKGPKEGVKDKQWKVYLNTTVEVDDI